MNAINIEVTVDTTKATAELNRLKALAESIPTFEVEDHAEMIWHWPWMYLVAAGAAGGLAVLSAFMLISALVKA